MSILYSMISGDFQKLMNPATIHQIVPSELLKKFGIVLVTIVQGIIQPYWTYKHLKSIDTIIEREGTLVLRFRELYKSLETLLHIHGFEFYRCPLPSLTNVRDATARVILQSNYFKMALKNLGALEVLICLASQKDLHPVSWVRHDTPIFEAKDTFDFQVKEPRKAISAQFTESRHALLTGPNKGGKSTVLRALSTSALLAHTYGCAFGHIRMTPFDKLFVCLKPDDLPGSKSRFEREIEFTANTLTHTNQRLLILIDELYHSTNPPDALRSCEIYCRQLWKKDQIVSVISTPLFEFVEQAPAEIQRICCPAQVNKKGEIQFEYDLISGVCKVSSVDSLLKSNGLWCDF